mgnify:CR=1 FL=1
MAASDDVTIHDVMASLGHSEVKAIEKDELIAPGAMVIAARVVSAPAGFALQLDFSDRSLATIVPRIDDDLAEDGAEVSDWEILTPHSRILKVGPGHRWRYVDSTVRPAR